jgi:Galactose oxidase, central domain
MVEASGGAIDVQSSNFVPTELPGAVDYFLCRICGYVVHQPKECPKCNCVYCFDCNNKFTLSNGGKWQCKECSCTENLTDVHRVVRELLDSLVFSCPKCSSVKRTYNEIFKHASTCDGVQ